MDALKATEPVSVAAAGWNGEAAGHNSSGSESPCYAGVVMNESINSYVSGLSAAQLDSTIAELLSTKRRCEWLVCRYLADIADEKRFQQVGYFSDVFHYAKERLDLGVKLTRERVRIGKGLRDLPRIEEAFVRGDLSYSKVREITREDDEPTKVLIRQVLGAVAQFEKSVLVSKLKVARDRMRAQKEHPLPDAP